MYGDRHRHESIKLQFIKDLLSVMTKTGIEPAKNGFANHHPTNEQLGLFGGISNWLEA